MADQFDDDAFDQPTAAVPAAGQDGFVEDGFADDDGFGDDDYVAPVVESEPVLVPPADNGFSFADGPADDAPPPAFHEAFVEPEPIREWRLKRQDEMAAQTKEELERKAQTKEQAANDLGSINEKRVDSITKNKGANREKEQQDLAALAAISQMPTWEAVATLVEADADAKKKKKKGEEDAKKTDVSRMRQLLIKLKNNPPAVKAS